MTGFCISKAEMRGSARFLQLQHHVVTFTACLLTCAIISVSGQDDIDGPRDPALVIDLIFWTHPINPNIIPTRGGLKL